MKGRFPAVAFALLLLGLPIVTATAQAPRRPAQGPPAAERALIEGRYEEVDALANQLDSRDPGVVALKARAAIARGRYQDAEAMLRPVADRAPTSEAALELGLLQRMLRRPDATALLDRVASLASRSNDPTELARAARALRALGDFQDANAVYRDAATGAPRDPAINTAWGELFLETYNRAEALKSFQAALAADARWAPALLGSAQALADENPPQAMAMAKRALEINPRSVDAHLFIAGGATDAGRRDEARESLKQAFAISPASLDAHALAAALAYIEDKQAEFEAEVAKVLAIAPGYGDVYRTAGELAAHNYRFDEAVALTRRALELEPGNPRALADLGVHLLRTGDEPAARAALEASFKIDPFSVVTFNLLGMLDTLDKFETIEDGDLVFRMNKDELPVLREYAVPLAHQALKTVGSHYGFTARGPILIEVFSKHDDFAVRNVGLPGMIGALGACFGRVVTLDSPKAQPPGTFQWEATLWHELAHVITLQMSNQRVPRWLTEGISVFEETRARPEWGRQMDVEFAAMLQRGQTLKLRDLNAGFMNPRTISLAYFEASLLVDHIASKWGDAGLGKLVRSFSTALDSDAALKAALDTGFDELQVSFDQVLDRRFGAIGRALAPLPGGPDLDTLPPSELRLLANLHAGSYQVQMALGEKLVGAKDLDEAMKAFERAAALVPLARGEDSPHARMAAIALEKNDRARALVELQALMAVDFDNVGIARQIAALMRETRIDEAAKLGPVYERIAAIDPFDALAHGTLGRLAMQRNDFDAASRAFRTVLALGPVDRASALTDLGESYLRAGKTADAKKQVLAALEIAPGYERAQALLLKLVGGRS